jgi:hypothetical protein
VLKVRLVRKGLRVLQELKDLPVLRAMSVLKVL